MHSCFALLRSARSALWTPLIDQSEVLLILTEQLADTRLAQWSHPEYITAWLATQGRSQPVRSQEQSHWA